MYLHHDSASVCATCVVLASCAVYSDHGRMLRSMSFRTPGTTPPDKPRRVLQCVQSQLEKLTGGAVSAYPRLLQGYPNHQQIPALMDWRWSQMLGLIGPPQRETIPCSRRRHKESSFIESVRDVKATGSLLASLLSFFPTSRMKQTAKAVRAADKYIALYPHDPRGGSLLVRNCSPLPDPGLEEIDLHPNRQ